MNNSDAQVFQEALTALIENLYRESVSNWLIEDCLDLMAWTVLGSDKRAGEVSLTAMQSLEAQEPALFALNSPKAEHLFNLIMGEFEPYLSPLELQKAVEALAEPDRTPLQRLREAQETVVEAWDYDGLAEASDEQLAVILNFNGTRVPAYSHMLMELLPIPSGWETGADAWQLVAV